VERKCTLFRIKVEFLSCVIYFCAYIFVLLSMIYNENINNQESHFITGVSKG